MAVDRTPPAPIPIEQLVPQILKLIGAMVREKAHGQIVITFRGGHVQLLTETRQHLPAKLTGA